MEREKCYYKWSSKYFEKINRNVENKNSVDYSITSEVIVFLQKEPPEVLCKKGYFRNFAKFTGKHLCQSHFFNKVAGQACNFIKKEALVQVFSCEFCEISTNTFFTEHFRTTASAFRYRENIKYSACINLNTNIFKRVCYIAWVPGWRVWRVSNFVVGGVGL